MVKTDSEQREESKMKEKSLSDYSNSKDEEESPISESGTSEEIEPKHKHQKQNYEEHKIQR